MLNNPIITFSLLFIYLYNANYVNNEYIIIDIIILFCLHEKIKI